MDIKKLNQGFIGKLNPKIATWFFNRLKKHPFTEDSQVIVQQFVDGMYPQVGHAQIIGIGIDKDYRQSPTPVLDDGAFFVECLCSRTPLDIPALFSPEFYHFLQRSGAISSSL